jgi:hypothetical protein
MDIVERLRIFAKYDPDQADAADEIEQLRAEIERYQKMLTSIYGKVPLDLLRDKNGNNKSPVDAIDAMLIEIVSLRIKLRKALGEKE